MITRYVVIPFVLISVTPALASSVTFSDGTFGAFTVAATYESDATNTTSSITQCPTCGTGGTQGLQAQVTFGTAATGNPNNANSLPQATFAIAENLFVYNPSTQGGILSINASVNKDFSSTENSMGIGNSFRPFIEQGGNFYLAMISGPLLNGPGDTGYNTLSANGLTAADFVLFNFTTGVSGAGNPNFDGSQITFGLAQNFNLAAGTTNTADYDDLSITVNQTPLPAALPLFAGGLGALAALGWRRKRKNAAAIAA
jgi:hypothetical protein